MAAEFCIIPSLTNYLPVYNFHKGFKTFQFLGKSNRLLVIIYFYCSEADAQVSYVKNPPNCVGGNLRIISYQYFSQSCFSAPA
jgi:hypothetical protein